MKIFDRDANEIADIEVSERQQQILKRGEQVTITYHTPQLLQHLIGNKSGAFDLAPLNALVIAPDVHALLKYVALQRAIAAAQKVRSNG